MNKLKLELILLDFPKVIFLGALKILKDLAKKPQYKKRIEEHLTQLNLSIANREKEINQTYLGEELAKMKKDKELIEFL